MSNDANEANTATETKTVTTKPTQTTKRTESSGPRDTIYIDKKPMMAYVKSTIIQ